jgi:hypothetical protein
LRFSASGNTVYRSASENGSNGGLLSCFAWLRFEQAAGLEYVDGEASAGVMDGALENEVVQQGMVGANSANRVGLPFIRRSRKICTVRKGLSA